ncbi:MAG: hypothetical protein AAF587_37595 [Bacteroidota bacterium]
MTNQTKEDPVIDEALVPISTFMEDLSDINGEVSDMQAGIRMQVQKAEIGLPIQLDIHVDDQGKVILGASPPLYYTETSYSPVFHQVEVRLEIVDPHSKGNGITESSMES